MKEYVSDNFHVTTSGFFLYPPLLCLLLVVEAECVMFAVDYLYSRNEQGKAFLDRAPLSLADREEPHGNAERLLGFVAEPEPAGRARRLATTRTPPGEGG